MEHNRKVMIRFVCVLASLASTKVSASIPVFVQGDLGLPCWRIPSTVLTMNEASGRVFVFAEGRNFTGDGCCPTQLHRNGDPCEIPTKTIPIRNIYFRYSDDGGHTWSTVQHVGGSNTYLGTVTDPAAVWLPKEGKLMVFYGGCYGLVEGEGGTPAQYEQGNCTYMRVSKDLGASWSEPQKVVPQGVAPSQYGVGWRPGTNGAKVTRSGRILMAGAMYHSVFGRGVSVLYSDDAGVSWSLATMQGTNSNSTTSSFVSFGEPALAELSDGSVLLSMRTETGIVRPAALSEDGGKTFRSTTEESKLLPQPKGGCEAALISQNKILLYSEPLSMYKNRSNMTVLLSKDDAKSWQPLPAVYPGPSAYSSLVNMAIESSMFAIVYERDWDTCTSNSASCSIVFNNISLPSVWT
eukprot:m.341838 g.341838  ORF g.341838 m.341838 type:complete len:408 (-) comp20572_c0_seq1:80-1303(-)